MSLLVYLIGAAVFLYGTYEDAASTYEGLRHRGLKEKNQLTVQFFKWFGMRTGLFVKTGIVEIGLVYALPMYLNAKYGMLTEMTYIIGGAWFILGITQCRVAKKNRELIAKYPRGREPKYEL